MELAVVNYANRNCSDFGTQILDRAMRFAYDMELDGDPEILWHTITQEMVKQNPEMLILAAVDGGKVYGHMICRIVNDDGCLIGLVTQLAIDEEQREGREETIMKGMEVVYAFSRSRGATRVRCWAMNEKLAILFTKFGLKPKDYVLMDIALEAQDGEKESD